MAAIVVGLEAIDRAESVVAEHTYINTVDAADGTGTLASVELWFATNATGVYVGAFIGPSSDWLPSLYYTGWSSANIGNVTAGSKQTFSGLSLDVALNSYLGIYFATGTLEKTASVSAGLISYYESNEVGTGGLHLYEVADGLFSLYGAGTTGTIAPSVTTQAPTVVTTMTATGNGNILDDGGGTITERGVCLNTTGDPDTGDTTFHDATNAEGAFTMAITGLVPSRYYYIKAYAINATGTSYGNQETFTARTPAMLW